MSGEPRGAIGPRTHDRRLRILQVGFLLLCVLYGGRLAQLQVVEGAEWRERALAQANRVQEIPAHRGGIYDRNGRALSLDGQQWRVYLAPRELKAPQAAAAAVARVLGLSEAERRRLAAARDGWVALPRRISSAERQRLMTAVHGGLHFEPLPSRVHPEGRLARPLLGGLDAEGHGGSGLELVMDSVLVGTPGAAVLRVDGLGSDYWLPGAQVALPRPGHDVVLTLDAELQGIAESALDRALAETGASGGDILILDPRTGEVLAVASRRGASGRTVPAFTDPYEPGSTLKPFLLAALLAEGRATLDEPIDVEGGTWRDGRRVFRDVHDYDTLTVAEVVRYSSNIGAAKLAARFEPGTQYGYLRDFGFGMPTGVRYPSESAGLLRRPERWSALSPASLAMGYEISVTSLQLAAAYGALANGGVLMRPYLVKEVRDGLGRTVWERRPEPLRRVVDEGVAGQVADVLTSVVREGTATGAALTALPVAGKTGTARLMGEGRYELRYAASFVGFTPADDPSLVILTKLEDPQGAFYGGTVAAPVGQAALRAALAARGDLLGRHLAAARASDPVRWGAPAPERRDGPFIFAVGRAPDRWEEPAPREAAGPVLPDLRGLPVRAAAARLHQLGLRVELEAAGEVTTMNPAPGSRVAPGATVTLR